MPNLIKIGGGQEHFGLFLVDFIWNDPFMELYLFVKNQTNTLTGTSEVLYPVYMGENTDPIYKIISQNKMFLLPTYPIFFQHVIGNRLFFLFGLV